MNKGLYREIHAVMLLDNKESVISELVKLSKTLM